MLAPNSPGLHRKLGRAALIAVLAGCVVAGAAVPASALAGWAFDHAGVSWDDLPEALRNPARIEASYLYASDGKTVLTTFYDQNRRDIRLADVAPAMREAVVAAEDTRFYEHGGVDLKGILRAAVANGTSGDVEQGASTLTMQYVRNVLKNDPSLTQEERDAATVVSTGRKIREMRYAVTVEQRLSKDEILERYMNIAYFGHGAYGVYAAAHTYFSKDPSALTLSESALLAGLLQSPEADNPVNGDQARALQRRTYVLQALVGTGTITAAQAATADAEKLALKPGGSPNDCTAATTSTGYFCDYFRRWWLAQNAFGATADDGCRSADRRLPDRDHIGPEGPGDGAVRGAEGIRLHQQARGADGGRAAGHRQGSGAGGQPALRFEHQARL